MGRRLAVTVASLLSFNELCINYYKLTRLFYDRVVIIYSIRNTFYPGTNTAGRFNERFLTLESVVEI
jgi:hypothetical protein